MIRNAAATKPSSLQARLLASLVAALYGIVDALIPIIETIANKPTRPQTRSWIERHRLSNRFYAIIRELLALTLRIEPTTLSKNPVFRQQRPARPSSAASAPSAEPRPSPAQARPPQSCYALSPLSLYRLAQRLAALLQKLERLAAEAGATLPTRLRRHAATARAIAGCNALPPHPHPTWERAS